ncbi:MAG: ATP-dependent protease subunit HslV [Fimbriimonadales bacterium]
MNIHATTILGVKRDGTVAIGGDGQVTLADQAVVLKHTARKVRRLAGGSVIAGFAGAVADAQALADKIEGKIEASRGNLRRAAVEFAKEWRTDKILRQLNAILVVADKDAMLVVTGDGNVLEPDSGVVGVGSGGPYAQAAATALLAHTSLSAEQIVSEALSIAADICVYTNRNLTIETIPAEGGS